MLMMTGCHMRSRQIVVSPPPVLPHKVASASDPVSMELQRRLNKNGMQVVTMGQDYLISIPSAALFTNQSPQLTWGSYALLNDVVCYLKQFRKIAVNVTTYSSKCVSPQRERALTLARSRAVSDYFWSQNIDSRFIFTHGLGSDKPIVRFTTSDDQSPNSRVEITFRDDVA